MDKLKLSKTNKNLQLNEFCGTLNCKSKKILLKVSTLIISNR